MYKIVDLDKDSLTFAQFRAGSTHPASARYSFEMDGEDFVYSEGGKAILGNEVILEWEGDEPEILQGLGTNYTRSELDQLKTQPKWTGPSV